MLMGSAQQMCVVVQVPQELREARRDELVSLQQHVGQGFAESLVGSEVRLRCLSQFAALNAYQVP